MASLADIAAACNCLLRTFADAEDHRRYLRSRVPDSIRDAYLFGYFPPAHKLHVLLNLLGPSGKEELLARKLIFPINVRSHIGVSSTFVSFFEHHQLVLPFHDTYGEVISLAGRSLLSDAERSEEKIAKYKNTIFNKANFLFNLNNAKDHILEEDEVYIVEGQLDTIAAAKAGLKNVVALCSSNMSDWQFQLLLRYTKNFTLLLDNDKSGQKGRDEIYRKYGGYIRLVNKYLPAPYKDVDEFLKENDLRTLRQFI
jgi:DNA primase